MYIICNKIICLRNFDPVLSPTFILFRKTSKNRFFNRDSRRRNERLSSFVISQEGYDRMTTTYAEVVVNNRAPMTTGLVVKVFLSFLIDSIYGCVYTSVFHRNITFTKYHHNYKNHSISIQPLQFF